MSILNNSNDAVVNGAEIEKIEKLSVAATCRQIQWPKINLDNSEQTLSRGL